MSDACDKCGLEDPECHCYLYELGQRVKFIEEELEKITIIVKTMSDLLRKYENNIFKS